jgi:hypothetical protein
MSDPHVPGSVQTGHAGSYGDWLAVAAPRLPGQLAPPASLAPAARVAAHLPADCLGVLEIRLGAGGPIEPVDLSIQVSEHRQAQQVLARVPTPRLQASLSAWAAGRISTEEIPSFWLEYDAGSIGDVNPAAGKIPEPMQLVQLSNAVRPRWLVDEYLPAFLGFTPPERQVARAVRAMQRLLPDLRPLYLFGLGSRGSDAFRVDTVGTTLAGVGQFLRDVISDEVARLAEAALPLLADAERVHFSFEITPDGFGTRVGMEGSYLKQPAREPGWLALLDRLVARELCTPAQRDAVLAWPGYDTARTAATWPGDGQGAPLPGICAYGLSHVKLAMSPERPLQAKAYLTAKLMRR